MTEFLQALILGLLIGVPIAQRLLKRDPALVLRFVALIGVIVAGCFALLTLTPYLAVVIGMHMVIAATAAVLAPGAYSVLSLAMPARVRSLGFALSALWLVPGLAIVLPVRVALKLPLVWMPVPACMSIP